jgi:hypothetical protein
MLHGVTKNDSMKRLTFPWIEHKYLIFLSRNSSVETCNHPRSTFFNVLVLATLLR